MTTFYIIRHAEKEKGEFYNSRLRHQDEPVNQKGQKDAERLWSFFSDKEVSAIYVSEYLRTAQTIAYVAGQLQSTPIADERLNEIDNGLIEGMSDQEIQQIYPEVWAGFHERKTDFRFPEGETAEEAQKRLADFLEEKRMEHNEEGIVAVSHEGLIRLLMCHILGLPIYKRWNFRMDFCGIMEITYQPDHAAWKLIRFNQTMD